MSRLASLDIRATVPGTTFALHNAQLERIEEGVVPMTLNLEPGLYMVREAPQTRPHVFELEEGRQYRLVLGPSGAGFHEDRRTRVARAVEWVHTPKTEASAAPAPSSSQTCPDTWVRFRRLTTWTESERAEPKHMSYHLEGDVLCLDLEMDAKSVVFVQVMVPRHRPVNTALPGSGQSRLKVAMGRGRPRTEAHLADQTTNSAAQYFRQGNFEEAKRILRTLDPPPEAPWLTRFLKGVTNRFKDPVASALGRYALLRTGESSWLKELPNLILNNFDWLADGRVVSAEIAARGGHADAALTTLIGVPTGCLPLFSDGFSMMLSRLIEYTRESEPSPMPTKEEDPDGTKTEAIRQRHERIAKARELLAAVQRWSPCLDLTALTLTFPGAFVERPEIQEETVADESWTKLELPTTVA